MNTPLDHLTQPHNSLAGETLIIMRGTAEFIAHTGKLLRGGRGTSNNYPGTTGTNQDCVGVN